MNFIITGATGFLGAHILLDLLRRHTEARILCLLRAHDKLSGIERINASLQKAILDSGIDCDVEILLPKILVIVTSLDSNEWQANPDFINWIENRAQVEVIHCAANLSFKPEDAENVWHSNVRNTETFLNALANIKQIKCFNYVSTAYVAGDTEGTILEDHDERPKKFNNIYEESKWTAENILKNKTIRTGLKFRIFRPSIIIAHSQTDRTSSLSGFYKVITTLQEMHLTYPDLKRAKVKSGVQPF